MLSICSSSFSFRFFYLSIFPDPAGASVECCGSCGSSDRFWSNDALSRTAAPRCTDTTEYLRKYPSQSLRNKLLACAVQLGGVILHIGGGDGRKVTLRKLEEKGKLLGHSLCRDWVFFLLKSSWSQVIVSAVTGNHTWSVMQFGFIQFFIKLVQNLAFSHFLMKILH